MSCYTPIKAFRSRNGVTFNPNDEENLYEIKLPCGQCIGCRLEYARQWSVRITHEASLHENNCFLTLTYDNDHINAQQSLVKADFQNFMKRLRKQFPRRKYGKIGYFMCGEYGENNSRPHYHSCLFNFEFQDKVRIEDSKSGHAQYESKTLDKIWQNGRATIGALTPESAAYVAGYVTKKIRGPNAASYYGDLTPEYSACSRKPAIGLKWIEKYYSDIYNYDTCMVGGKTQRPPRYYDKFYEKNFPEKFADTKIKREITASLNSDSPEYSTERLNVKHKVHLVKQNNIKRTYDTLSEKTVLSPVEAYDKKVVQYRDEQLSSN